MFDSTFVGPLLRMKRLERNWSQETLCSGICAVSYLSKIEQGKVQPNITIICELFRKLGIIWNDNTDSIKTINDLCEQGYEVIYSRRWGEFDALIKALDAHWDRAVNSMFCLDVLCLRAFFTWDESVIPQELRIYLNDSQRSLLYLLQKDYQSAVRCHPCALTYMLYGADNYAKAAYTLALEQLQKAYDFAAQEGYVMIMLYSKLYMANTYSDLRDLAQMQYHSEIALRLTRAVQDHALERTIHYNLYSTQIECGQYDTAYDYFSLLQTDDTLTLHKLAVCCEKLGRLDEASEAIRKALLNASGLERMMCLLVRYRLEHNTFLHDEAYGEMLINTFRALQKERPAGYAKFHVPWVEEWCIANRKYRLAYETLKNFT